MPLAPQFRGWWKKPSGMGGIFPRPFRNFPQFDFHPPPYLLYVSLRSNRCLSVSQLEQIAVEDFLQPA
jgi:hypothetical protein